MTSAMELQRNQEAHTSASVLLATPSLDGRQQGVLLDINSVLAQYGQAMLRVGQMQEQIDTLTRQLEEVRNREQEWDLSGLCQRGTKT